MNPEIINQTLRMGGQVEVPGPTGMSKVWIARVGSWQGSPFFGHWIVMAPLYFLRRVVSGERRWEVRVADEGSRVGEITVATLNSRDEAIEAAIAVALERHSSGP